MKPIKTLSIFGTRPEAIKMSSLLIAQSQDDRFDSHVCLTGQHREMLDSVIGLFDIKVHHDLNIMRPQQSLSEVTARMIEGITPVIEKVKPDLVFVHGDTATTLSGALCSYFARVPLAHVEAGLRTHNLFSPWPEEGNRRVSGVFAKYHFAPTKQAAKNLIEENVDQSSIYITGNTVIDSLLTARAKIRNDDSYKKEVSQLVGFELTKKKIILVTGHRRENFGEGFENICESLKRICLQHPDVEVVYPVHLNPNVREPVNRILSNLPNLSLIEPLDYFQFITLLDVANIVLTDSGGIQEEAPALGKPVLVMRDTTERPEAIEAGTARLVGTDPEVIVKEVSKLIEDVKAYEAMSTASNPYGDGQACQRILEILAKGEFGV